MSPSDLRTIGILRLFGMVWEHMYTILLLILILLSRPLTQTERDQIIAEYESIGEIFKKHLPQLTR